jgi:hypothetical protein
MFCHVLAILFPFCGEKPANFEYIKTPFPMYPDWAYAIIWSGVLEWSVVLECCIGVWNGV